MHWDIDSKAAAGQTDRISMIRIGYPLVRVSHAITQHLSTEMGIIYAALPLFC